jgi:hypothetical protein
VQLSVVYESQWITVFLAAVLFLVGIGSSFKLPGIRYALGAGVSAGRVRSPRVWMWHMMMRRSTR